MKVKKFLAAFLSAAMVITSAAVPVLADGGNTLTVGKGKTYDNVQTALDNANEGDTIAIDAGEYDAFKVEKNNITLTAADKNNKPVINTLYDSAATFENLVFHTGESTGSSSLGTPNSGDHGSLTVKGCVFYGNATTAYAVWMNHGNMTIEDCYFNNYGNKQSTGGAIQPYTLNDMEKLTVKNSEIVDCFPYAINVQAGKGEIEIADSVFLNSNIQVANNPPDSTGICNISNSSAYNNSKGERYNWWSAVPW